MWEDPIVKEIHKTREKILKENNYDSEIMFKKSKKNLEVLKKEGWNIVTKEDLKEKILTK